MPINSHLKWQVNYEPGKLEAIAYRKNKKLTTLVQTTSEPTILILEASKKIMLPMAKMLLL
jgi:beta-galactosidase